MIYVLVLVPRYSLLAHINGPYEGVGSMSGTTYPAFAAFVLAFSGLFVLFGLAWREVRRFQDRETLWLVLAVGAIFAFTASFIYPVTALDVFTYVDQSVIMMQYHQNPIFVPPASFPHDPLMSLSGGWAPVGSPYGPLGIAIDALPTVLVGRHLLVNVLLLKVMFSGLTLGSAFLVYRIVRHVEPQLALAGALLVAWNPLVLFEVSANGHNDAAMMFLALLALASMAEDELTLGPLLLVASILVKYTTLVLLPLFLLYGVSRQPTWSKRGRYVLTTTTSMLVLVVAAYLPFWDGPATFNRALLENQFYLYSFGSTLSNLSLGHLTPEQATLIGRVLFVPAYLYALWLATRDLRGLLLGCFVAMFAFLGLAVNNVKYWYAVALNLLAAAVPAEAQRLAAVVGAAAMEIMVVPLNVFVWTWVGVNAQAFQPINNVSYVLIFILPAALLLAPRPVGVSQTLTFVSERRHTDSA